LAVVGAVHTVDVSSITAGGEDAINMPAELGVLGSPFNTRSVGSSILVLLRPFFVDGPVKDFMSTAV